MKIRPAEIVDSTSISEIHKLAIMITNKPFYTQKELNNWLGNRTLVDYENMIKNGLVFVAEENGQVLGFSNIDFSRDRIKAIYVHPNFERRGVGKILIEHLINLAKEKGCLKLSLDSSTAAKNFYLKNGFKLINEVEHKCRTGGTILGHMRELTL